LGLAVEALEHRGIVSNSSSDSLKGDKPIDKRIAGTVHHSHSAVAQLSENLIFAQLFQRMFPLWR
jgi:hypothetical protein